MTKQEYLLEILNAMPNREMGWGIKAMVENNQLEERVLDSLIVVISKSVNKIANIGEQHHVIAILKSIYSFNAQKEAQAQQDTEDLAKLDSLLDEF